MTQCLTSSRDRDTQSSGSKKWAPTALVPTRTRRAVEINESPPKRRGMRWRMVRWFVRFNFCKIRRKQPTRELAIELKNILSDLGGVGVKVGQLLSLRPDVFSTEFCDVLAQLQFQHVGFPATVARECVERELGRPIEEVFDVFEDQPLAAASIAQVHRARLRHEQVWVAVKIQRPNVEEDFIRDLRVVRRWVNRFSKFDSLSHLSWGEFMWELEKTVMEEVDYRYEIDNLKRMRKNLKKHKVRVPKSYKYSTPKVLVMEFMPGVLMSDILAVANHDPERLNQWLQENNVDLEKVGRRLFFSFQRQVSEENLFHGDLHPGNIMVLKNSRVALIDFGSVGSLDPEVVELMGCYYRTIASQDFMASADYMLLVMGRIPRMDPEEFRPQVANTFRRWLRRSRVKGLSYKEKAFSEASLEVSKLIAKHKVLVGWEFMRINRASITLEASLRFLQPDADQAKLMSKHVAAQDKRHQQRLFAQLREQLANLPSELAFVTDLQERILRNRGRSIQTAMSKASRAANAFFSIVKFVAAAVLLLALLPRPSWLWVPPMIDAVPTFVLVVIAFPLFLTARSLCRFVKLPDVKP